MRIALLLLLPFFVNNVQARSDHSEIFLNDRLTKVFFNDGDSFRVLEGPFKKTRARLQGFNTLEAYGPVHQWGQWEAGELSQMAHSSTLFARKGGWHCESKGRRDRYNRILWQCEDLAVALLENGLGHMMSVSKVKPKKILQKAQAKAVAGRVGMWAKGTPLYILTSAHSIDEESSLKSYDRLVSTQTGLSLVKNHTNLYRECERVCYEFSRKESGNLDQATCLVYVNYKKRYGQGRAECLKNKEMANVESR